MKRRSLVDPELVAEIDGEFSVSVLYDITRDWTAYQARVRDIAKNLGLTETDSGVGPVGIRGVQQRDHFFSTRSEEVALKAFGAFVALDFPVTASIRKAMATKGGKGISWRAIM